jgi:drug/metabolite transporter (DMT)-like permease
MLWDDRWSAFRRVFQAQLVSLACILLAIAVRLADFDWNRPSAWLFAIGIVVSAAVYALFYFSLERRATRSV